MISALYVEEAVRDSPAVVRLSKRFPNVPTIACERYTQIFNQHRQDFRTQKKRPAMILAEKRNGHVLPTPPNYGIGGRNNYYFSHLLNCLYDCRYCFLQGMYRSAHYVFFVNDGDFQQAIDAKLEEHADEDVYFFSGYDCDSFALESLTAFVNRYLPFFADRPRAILELRTKSLKARSLLDHTPFPNIVAAFSLTPIEVSQKYEIGVPPLDKRLKTMHDLATVGWKIGLRFDPIIAHQDSEAQYQNLFHQVFEHLPADAIHSVTIGAMRFPKGIYKQIACQFPEEPLFAAGHHETKDLIAFDCQKGASVAEMAIEMLKPHVGSDRLFVC